VRHGQCQLRDTAPPTPVWLMRRTLEGGPAAPSNPSLMNLQGQTMTSGRQERHPRPCSATSGCYNNSGAVEHAGTGRHHACHCTPYGSPSTTSSSPPEDAPANHYAFTLEDAPVQVRDTPRRQDRGKDRPDTANSPALYAIPPHVAKQCGMPVNHPLLGL
jgi:hypothetical protein